MATQFGEDVLIAGAGPISLTAIPVVLYAGARHVVITGMNPFRLDLARKMGAALAVDPSETPLAEVQKQLGMEEGFDVGLDQRVWLAFLDVDRTLTSAAK